MLDEAEQKQRITYKKVIVCCHSDHDDLVEIYTHNTDLKKRLSVYAKEYPELCQLTEDDEQDGFKSEGKEKWTTKEKLLP